MEQVEGGQNCDGIYQSCFVVAAVLGASVIAASSGLAVYWGGVVGLAGMEYCRQQAIGCHGTVK
ncbi:MAG: hypothetical protein ACI83B_003523 [Sediminicola sp.]|jgi:hypothetical protein